MNEIWIVPDNDVPVHKETGLSEENVADLASRFRKLIWFFKESDVNT